MAHFPRKNNAHQPDSQEGRYNIDLLLLLRLSPDRCTVGAQDVDVAFLVQIEHFSFVYFPFIASKTAKESTREKNDNYLASTCMRFALKPRISGTASWKNFILTYL